MTRQDTGAMDKLDELPQYSRYDRETTRSRRVNRRRRLIRLAFLTCVGYILYSAFKSPTYYINKDVTATADRLESDYRRCSDLRRVPQDPHGPRQRNARFVEGQRSILIRNATVWTGEPSRDVTPAEARAGKGYEWIQADVLLQNGLIVLVERDIGHKDIPADTEVFEARGRQLTAGIVDMHSHAGVDSLPGLRGNDDTNELSSDVTPFVRSLDGFNVLDRHLQIIKSGGITTSLILPGSGNNIGGEAYVIKHSVGKADGRPELSAHDMLADPEHNWRYMKMACGENAKSVYGKVGRDFGPFSRLGEAWYFRRAFEQATKLKNAQDDWCETADRIGARNMPSNLPLDLKWESLVAVLRGQVMVNTHCYTVPDLESYIGFTNEFNFSVRAFHHAHQNYLVPEILKRNYGGRPPAAALFADNMYYKAESYVASEQAGKILYENGITPVYVSDNPVLNSQHVVVEAAKAYKNGLPYHVALAGVTSASAELLGLGQRIGKVVPGFDADIVVWDSDPLSLGAAPVQVFIDGTPQIKDPVELVKAVAAPMKHLTDSAVHVEHSEIDSIVVSGITTVMIAGHEHSISETSPGHVVITNGKITCMGVCTAEVLRAQNVLHLVDGHIAPTLTAFGSLLGLEEIAAEDDTSDGANGPDTFSAAIDGLTFEGKNMQAAWSHGVTRAISAPAFNGGGHKGISAGLRVAAKHSLSKGAIFNAETALHYSLIPGVKQGNTPTFSSAVAELKAKLLKATKSTKKTEEKSPEDIALEKVIAGNLTLVIDVHSADAIASLLRIKTEIEEAVAHSARSSTSRLRLAILGGAESYLLATELAEADVGVILAPVFAYSVTWDQRRSLPGAPLSNGTAVDILCGAGVKVALGVDEDWEARDLFVQAGTVLANSGGRINASEAIALASRNIYDILGLEEHAAADEFVIFEGSPLTINGQRRIVAGGMGKINVWS